MKRLVGVLVPALLLVAGCEGSGLEPSQNGVGGREAVEEGPTSAQAATEVCPSEARYSDRWTAVALGGPTIGPITLAVGGPRRKRIGLLNSNGEWLVKLLILVDAPTGERITATANQLNGKAVGRFTHFSNTLAGSGQPSYADGRDRLDGTVMGHQDSDLGPKDIPGFLLVETPGCYQLTFTLGNQTYGPFGLEIGAP